MTMAKVVEDSRRLRLRSLERKIGLGPKSHAGMELMLIRGDELYRAKGYNTFEGYCQGEFGWTSDEAEGLIREAMEFAMDCYRKAGPVPAR
jgi:hypothetical protein